MGSFWKLKMLSLTSVCAIVIVLAVNLQAQESAVPADSSAPASRNRPIPKIDYIIPWMGMKIFGLNAESNKPVLGLPTVSDDERRYFYLPLFCFQKNSFGQVDVSTNDDGEIRLPMIYDSDEARKAVFTYLIEKKLIPVDAKDGQVQTVAAKMWYMETLDYEPKVRFGPYENFNFPYKGVLRTRLTPVAAKKFVNDLLAGTVSLHPTIIFEGYSFQDNSLSINADDIFNSDQYRKLTGPGSEGKVSRHQVASIAREACESRKIAITTEYSDSDFNALVESIVKNYAEKESHLTPNWDEVEAFFDKVGFDPDQFKADLIESNKYNENKEARDQLSTDIDKSFDHDGKVGWGALSIAGSWKYGQDEKIAKDVFSKWGLQTDFTGKVFIPKSIDVYTLNAAKIRMSITFAVGKRKKYVSDGMLAVAVDPINNVLHTTVAPLYEERLDEVTAAAKKLRDDLGAPLDTRTFETLKAKLVCTTLFKLVMPPGQGGGDFQGDGSAKQYEFTIDDAAVVLGAWISVGARNPDEQRVFRTGANYIGARPIGGNRVGFNCPVSNGDPKIGVPITVIYLKR